VLAVSSDLEATWDDYAPLCRYNLGNQLSSLSATMKEGESTYTASVNSRQVCCA
jgi:hypothetical protein